MSDFRRISVGHPYGTFARLLNTPLTCLTQMLRAEAIAALERLKEVNRDGWAELVRGMPSLE